MAKEIKVKTWKNVAGNLVIPYENMPPYLQKKVDKLNYYQNNFTITLSVPDPRGDWIEKWYKEAKKDYDVIFHHHKTVTICISRWQTSDGFGISDVCKGDTYDRKTGIAVAYAKFRNELIPDFI